MDSQIFQVGKQMMEALSLSANVTTSCPLKSNVQQLNLIQVLMNTILGTVVAFLAILCIQLNYSLMLSDVDSKTYEYGMLRALGFNKRNVMAAVLLQGLTFSIPGIILGISVSALLNWGVRDLIYYYTDNTASYALSPASVVMGLCLGFFIPLLSNILPIRNALGKNLRASLDLYHRQSD